MTDTHNDFGLYWHADCSDSFETRSFNTYAKNILKEIANGYESMTISRAGGAVIQFWMPQGYLRRREQVLDEKLMHEGIEEDVLPFVLPVDDFLKNKIVSESLVDEEEWRSNEGEYAEISLPNRLIDAISDACDRWGAYNRNQKARWVSNAVIAFEASQFSSLVERIETKEQLLATLHGDQVTEPTQTYNLIMESNNYRENLREQVQAARPEETDAEAERMRKIDPNEDIVLTKDEEPNWTDLPKSQRYRIGPFLGVLRRIKEKDGDGFGKKQIEAMLDYRFEDYESVDYVLREHVLPHLVRGADELYYLDEKNAPEPATVEDVAKDVKKLSNMNAVSRSAKDYIEREFGKELLDIFTSQYDGIGVYAADPEDFTKLFSQDELERVRDYLMGSLSSDQAENFVESESESLRLEQL